MQKIHTKPGKSDNAIKDVNQIRYCDTTLLGIYPLNGTQIVAQLTVSSAAYGLGLGLLGVLLLGTLLDGPLALVGHLAGVLYDLHLVAGLLLVLHLLAVGVLVIVLFLE